MVFFVTVYNVTNLCTCHTFRHSVVAQAYLLSSNLLYSIKYQNTRTLILWAIFHEQNSFDVVSRSGGRFGGSKVDDIISSRSTSFAGVFPVARA